MNSTSKVRRSLAAIAMASIFAIGLSGCAAEASSGSGKTVEPAPTASASVMPAVSLCDPASSALGDSVPSKEVTDARGVYCATVINPAAAALTEDTSKYEATLSEFKVTNDEAFSVQKKAVEFLASEGLDSSLLDSTYDPAGTEGSVWAAAHSDLLDPAWQSSYDSSSELYDTQFVIGGHGTPLLRDGGPRIAKSSISVGRVYAQTPTDSSSRQVIVELNATVSYRADDTSALAMVTMLYPDETTETLKVKYPELFDGTGENNILLKNGVFLYSFSMDTQKITGNDSKYVLNYSSTAGL